MYQPGTKSYVLNDLHIFFQELQNNGGNVDDALSSVGMAGIDDAFAAIEDVRDKSEEAISLYLYDDGSDDAPLTIIGPPDNFEELCREWNKLDDQLVETGEQPEGWEPFSDWMRDRGVNIPRIIEVDNLTNYREEE